MHLPTRKEGSITIASLIGQIDSVNAPELERSLMQLLDGDTQHLLIDCSGLEYINSAGLRVFLLSAKRLENQPGALAFCSLNDNIRMIFETIGFDRVLTVYPDATSAIIGMKSAQAKAA